VIPSNGKKGYFSTHQRIVENHIVVLKDCPAKSHAILATIGIYKCRVCANSKVSIALKKHEWIVFF
jgi:hypothetical protein